MLARAGMDESFEKSPLASALTTAPPPVLHDERAFGGGTFGS